MIQWRMTLSVVQQTIVRKFKRFLGYTTINSYWLVEMIGRSFADTGGRTDPKEFSGVLAKGGGFKWKLQGRNETSYTVDAFLQGTFTGPEVIADRTYLSCLAIITIEGLKNQANLDVPMNEVKIERLPYSYENRLPFWVTKDYMMFTSASAARQYLLPFMKNVAGLDLSIPEYDVKSIYEDYKQSGQVGGFGFMDRPDAIGSGSVYGDIDMTDPLIVELDDSEKNFVCLRLMINSEEISANIYKSGTLVIKKNWNSMANYLEKLVEIRDTLRKYEIQSSV